MDKKHVFLFINNCSTGRRKLSEYKFNCEEELNHFEKIWQMRPPVDKKISHSKDSWNKRAENWAKELENTEHKKRSDERLKATFDFINRYNVINKESKVIDIGCGLGLYVNEFAKTAGYITGIDLSPYMIEYAENFVSGKFPDKKIVWKACDFKNIDIDETGWRKCFDLVFTSLTPAVDGLESIKKICDMSKGYCFNSTFVSSDDNIDKYLYEKLTGKEFDEEFKKHHHWYYALYNLLFLKGYYPRSDYYEEKWTSYIEADDKQTEFFADRMKMKYKIDNVNADRIKELLLKKSDSDGKIRYDHHTVYGFLLWNVNGRL